EEGQATQVMADTGEGSLEPVALSLPQFPGEEVGAPQDPADCCHTLQILVNGDHSLQATEAGQEVAPPPKEGLEAASAFMTTDGSLKNGFQSGERRGPGGEKTPETCDSGSSRIEVMAKAKASETEKWTTLSVAVDAKPVGGEMQVVEENKGVDEVKEVAEPQPRNVDPVLNPLEAIQVELDQVNAQANRAFLQLERKFGRMRQYYLEQRNYIIQNIPGFWFNAIRNHPQLSPMIRGQDAEMLRYITNLEVKELRRPKMGCKFKFFFRRNPYFKNKLLVKEYEARVSGQVMSLSTPILWREGYEPHSFIGRNQDVVCSFFTWFSDHSLPESDRIAEIIKEDLWPNPLQYYLWREGARGVGHLQIREPVEIPRPFGFQSG
uniref:TSPY like 6 n=2 Tax=Otolemur garnettii TaxID=30611 RepID=H0XWM8_OTOGA